MISIAFYSILNVSSNQLNCVQVLIDVFYRDKWKKRLISKSCPIDIEPYSEKEFDQNFFIEFKQVMKVKDVKINVFMIGTVNSQDIDLKNNNNKSFMLTSQSSLNDMQILGGAHLVLKKLI